MSQDALFAVTRFGLDYERLRLEAASRNISVANMPNAPGHPVRIARAQLDTGFASVLGAPFPRASLETSAVENRLVHDPSSPFADQNGMVSYPKIDLVQEMGTLISASHGYEANVRAFNALHGMLLAALNIGGRQS